MNWRVTVKSTVGNRADMSKVLELECSSIDLITKQVASEQRGHLEVTEGSEDGMRMTEFIQERKMQLIALPLLAIVAEGSPQNADHADFRLQTVQIMQNKYFFLLFLFLHLLLARIWFGSGYIN